MGDGRVRVSSRSGKPQLGNVPSVPTFHVFPRFPRFPLGFSGAFRILHVELSY
jgi:hypothetical protein